MFVVSGDPTWANEYPEYDEGPKRIRQLQNELDNGMRRGLVCRATTRTGKPCTKWASPFQTVCINHGAGVERARRAAHARQVIAYRTWQKTPVDQRHRMFPCWPPDPEMEEPLFELRKKQPGPKIRAAKLAATKAEKLAEFERRETEDQPARLRSSWTDTRDLWGRQAGLGRINRGH